MDGARNDALLHLVLLADVDHDRFAGPRAGGVQLANIDLVDPGLDVFEHVAITGHVASKSTRARPKSFRPIPSPRLRGRAGWGPKSWWGSGPSPAWRRSPRSPGWFPRQLDRCAPPSCRR